MQVVTNEQFVASKARIGKIGTLVGLGALIAGFITSLNIQAGTTSQAILISYAFLIVGILAFNVGRFHSLRWGVRPRQDEVLANSLKGLDQKYVLLNYVEGLPASHLLLSPLGLFVIESRIHDGDIVCEGDRWKRKRSVTTIIRSFVEGSLGNPSREAQQSISNVKSFLTERLDSSMADAVPVEAVIVFVNPLANLTVTNPVVPVVQPKDLRNQVRSVQGRTKMTPDIYRRLVDVFKTNEVPVKAEVRTARERKRK